MNTFKNWASVFFGTVMVVAVSPVSASDITREVRGDGSGTALESGGYFAISVSANAGLVTREKKNENDTAKGYWNAGFAFSGAYRYNRLFIEAERGSLDGLNLGYTVWSDPHWSADLLFSVPGGSLTKGDREYKVASQALSEKQRSDNLLDRASKDRWLTGVGTRLTGYFDDYIVQYRLLADVHKGNGVFSSLRAGRSWQHRNWNFYGLLSAEYHSKDISNYFYGISSEEATSRFSQYQADEGFKVSGQLGLTYPLSEHWVLDSSVHIASQSSASRHSPLSNGRAYYAASALSISYVF